MKNENKIILGGISVVAITLLMGMFYFLMSEQIKTLALKSHETTNSAFLSSSATSFLSKNDFTSGKLDEKKIVFEKFFQEIKSDQICESKFGVRRYYSLF